MNNPKYIKDPITGAVVFQDADAYANRKEIIKKQKDIKSVNNDTKTVINSLRNEVTELKNLVTILLKDKEL
jgi:hypothetical protein